VRYFTPLLLLALLATPGCIDTDPPVDDDDTTGDDDSGECFVTRPGHYIRALLQRILKLASSD